MLGSLQAARDRRAARIAEKRQALFGTEEPPKE